MKQNSLLLETVKQSCGNSLTRWLALTVLGSFAPLPLARRFPFGGGLT